MKILVISDSHGNRNKINEVVKNYKYDYLFFLGDGISDLGNLIYSDNTKVVRGNCDFFSDYPVYEIIELENKKILITHGHAQAVKKNLNELIIFAKQQKADYVFYGHTHIPFNQKIDNITFINPGSLHKNRDKTSTFGVFSINKEKSDFNLIEF